MPTGGRYSSAKRSASGKIRLAVSFSCEKLRPNLTFWNL
jgi:hypothetical protein